MRKKQGSREKICKAALRLFTEKGIKATTTKQIARKAGVAEGTIYIYFSSKDRLAYELFLEHMNHFRELLSNSVSNITEAARTEVPYPPNNKLIETFYRFASEDPLIYSYIIIGHHTELKKMSAPKPKDIFVDTIKKGIEEGIFRKTDPNLSAAYIIGMITRSIIFYKNGLLKCSYGELIEETENCSERLLSEKTV